MMRHALGMMTLTAALAAAALAQDAPAPATSVQYKDGVYSLTTRDIKDQPVVVPGGKKVSIVVYVMVGQQRSHTALAHVQSALKDIPDAQALAVVSGSSAAIDARRLGALAEWARPVVADADYRIADAGDARAWPTTLVIGEDGKRLAHIGGLTSTYVKDITAYVRFAAGKITQQQLDEKLKSHDVVAATPQHIADRHLAVAQRLIAQEQYEPALDELKRALEVQPDDARVKLAMGRTLVLLGQPAEALQMLRKVDAETVAAWQVHAVRGRALAALKQWDEARVELVEAVKQNPAPAACYYDLGRAYQHRGDWQKAAEAFRAAYESRHTDDVPQTTAPRP